MTVRYIQLSCRCLQASYTPSPSVCPIRACTSVIDRARVARNLEINEKVSRPLRWSEALQELGIFTFLITSHTCPGSAYSSRVASPHTAIISPLSNQVLQCEGALVALARAVAALPIVSHPIAPTAAAQSLTTVRLDRTPSFSSAESIRVSHEHRAAVWPHSARPGRSPSIQMPRPLLLLARQLPCCTSVRERFSCMRLLS